MSNDSELGLGLAPGSRHYRAYVGPPEDYDLIGAMTFSLLAALGLRQHHRLLDIGCGSLRIGRLLIPYLNRGNYVGIEPNRWLVYDAIRHEIGKSLVSIKRPLFLYADSAHNLDKGIRFDFAVAQSIFSHTGMDLMERWLDETRQVLKDSGVLVATFTPGPSDSAASGWIYPLCVNFRPATMERLAGKYGFHFRILDWRHPRQAWALFSMSKFKAPWIENSLSWNGYMDSQLK